MIYDTFCCWFRYPSRQMQHLSPCSSTKSDSISFSKEDFATTWPFSFIWGVCVHVCVGGEGDSWLPSRSSGELEVWFGGMDCDSPVSLSFIKSSAHTLCVYVLCRSIRYCIYKACLIPEPSLFYFQFVLTIIHRSGREAKNDGKGLVSFITWVDVRWM